MTDIYHVPCLSVNLLLVAQITSTCKTVKFWLDRFVVEDLNNVGSPIVVGNMDPKDWLYKFCDSPVLTTLIIEG